MHRKNQSRAYPQSNKWGRTELSRTSQNGIAVYSKIPSTTDRRVYTVINMKNNMEKADIATRILAQGRLLAHELGTIRPLDRYRLNAAAASGAKVQD